MAFEEDIAAVLATAGVGTVLTDIFTGTLPSTPQNCAAVIPTGGIRLSGDINALQRPTFQVLVRDKKWSLGMAKSRLVFASLDRKWNLASTAKGQVIADHEPGVAFRDTNNLLVFSLNFTATVHR